MRNFKFYYKSYRWFVKETIILGHGAYPLSTYLLKPYPLIVNLSKTKCLSFVRAVVGRAFGILNARWRCLLKLLYSSIENVSTIIMTCCVLHNICHISWDEYINDDGLLFLLYFKFTRTHNSTIQIQKILKYRYKARFKL